MPSEDGSDSPLWYFAYGSNLDPARFRDRVGEWLDRRRARLHGFRLRFSGDVTSEGGGGAILVRDPDAAVHGAAYRIRREQLAAMDRVEFDASRDRTGAGTRITVRLDCDGEPLDAEVYTIRRPATFRAPSARYLEHILTGLKAAGHPAAVLDEVRAVARAEPG